MALSSDRKPVEETDLSRFNNDWFTPGGVFRRSLWYLTNALFFLNPLHPFSGVKVWLLRLFGARIGKGVVIKPGTNIKFPWQLSIGDHCWIGENVWIDNLTKVTIGSHVCLSQGAMILTGNHDFTSRHFDLMIGAITLQNGVWIGARAVVCPGVTCYSHAVLTVQSVATGDLESYGIYQGNPAVKIRDRKIEIKNDKKA
ncbi:MAG: colanic acid biosynthesis acetyltransferase WcaF [Lewinellaceae bacterium]|nr:colanic acid biosynthesis acetyltransferase WcaF [Lewinellaceae bacterium]